MSTLETEPLPGGNGDTAKASDSDLTLPSQENDLHINAATIELLRIINATSSIRELSSSVTSFLKHWLHCDAIGIRLSEGEDFPYYQTSGFPERFVRAERTLCAHDAHGGVIRDSDGNAMLDCMCGNILSKRTDPSKEFFTPHGSFWSNCTTDLLASTTEADRQIRTRNRCNKEGYESVGLFPLRLGGETFGLLQVNDKRQGMFTPEKIAFLEMFGDNLAIRLAHLRSEEALRESEERYRLIIENSTDGILFTIPDGDILTANPEACRILGRSEEEIKKAGRSGLLDLTDPRLRIALEQRQATGSFKGTLNFKRVDGRPFPVDLSSSIFSDSRGNMRTSIIFRDITDRMQAEERLHELSQAIEQSPVSIVITDTLGAIEYVNPKFVEVTGYSYNEAIGQNPRILKSGDMEAAEYKELWDAILAGNEWQGVFHNRKRSGELYWEAARISPIVNALGETTHFLAIKEDITERRLAEEAVRESELKFKSAQEENTTMLAKLSAQVPGVIYQYRLYPDGRAAFPYSSPGMYDIYELTPDELREDAAAVYERLHPDDRDTIMSTIMESARTLQLFHSEYRVVLPRQGLRWRLCDSKPERMDDGSTLWYGIITDITDRKETEENLRRMEARLRQSEKMEAVGQLAGGIAHDFNNVLGGIIGFTDLSLAFADRGTMLENNLLKVLKAADRAKHLVQQILAFSRQGNPQKTVTSLKPIVKEVLDLLRPSIPSSVIIESTLDNTVKNILADPTQIHQALLNLATNAVHAMNRKGTLSVRLYATTLHTIALGRSGELLPGDYSVIEVEDTGCGMDELTLSKAFEPFFTTKAVGEGTGMGLSVVLGIVQSHGGDVQTESRPGVGTTVRLFLPTIEEPLTDAGTSENRNLFKGSERILFVDDEPMLVDMTGSALMRLGYSYTGMTDSMTALQYLREHAADVDILITDQTMPRLTGMELTKEARKLKTDLPVIICTGFSNELNPERAVANGISLLLMKPYSPHEISKAIRSVLDNKK